MGTGNKPSRSTYSLSSGQTTEIDRADVERSEVELSDATDVEKLAPVAEQPPAPPRGPPPQNDLFQPRSFKFWMILVSNFLALFLVALDRTIVATAVPRISDDFHSLGDIGWYASAYMLTTSASQLIFGRLYKFYSMKWTFLSCVVIFEIGSAICGAAPNSPVFIVGRAVAGVASAGIFSGCMLIMVPMIPLHKRPMFQGLFGVVFGLASVIGPLVGGAFTSSLSWRWCFYINLPIGGFTLLFMAFFWRPPPQKHVPASLWTHIKRLDPLGTLFFLPGIVSLLLALQWGGSTYPWKSWRIIPLFIVFGALMIAFAVVQITMPETATLPPRVVMQRSVLSGALYTFFLSAAMLMLVYYVPVWFQTAKMVNPLRSGVYTIPLVLSLVVSSIMSGIFTQKIGYYVPSMILAPCIMSIGEGLMSTFTPNTGSSHWIAFQFLAGFGLGFGMQIGNLAAQTVLKPEDISTGVAIMFFVQQLGGAVFTTVGQAILSNLLVSQLRRIPGIRPEEIVNNGATELARIVPPQYLPLVIKSYNYACTRIFLTAMGMSFCALITSFFMEWRSIKKPPGAGPPGGGPPGGGGALRGPNAGGPSGPGIPAGLGKPPMSTVDFKSASPALTLSSNGRGGAPSMSATTAVGSEGMTPAAGKKRGSEESDLDGLQKQYLPLDPKIEKARREADEKLRQARRESDPSYTKPHRNSMRLSKSYKRDSGTFE
ncbi:major facilitator superfamily transporter aflatoxin efflux [Niveomyces insectorum RCEF 264]|uniref:Major facilitator superfamily transporter aflatoxin efflux n=1 Tax=Niveomyces insectorum RCEF 264 TaxID=1081102 RepID=A0A168A918_9HYPO|nr:major facilitator superfamily transporter aflatoxin efflux [Niveomyces insectorum RCEF 264]